MEHTEVQAIARAYANIQDNSFRKKNILDGALLKTLLAFWLLVPGAVFAAVSSEDFDTIPAQIVPPTSFFNNGSSVDWTFGQGPSNAHIAIAGNSNGGTFTNGLSNDFSGDSVLFLNYDGCTAPGGTSGCPGTTDITNFYMKSTDGSNFKLDSFQLGNNLAGYSTTGTITVKLGNTTVGSTLFDLNVSSSANGITYTYEGDSSGGSARPYGTFTFDTTRYRNVNQIDLDYPASSTPLIENVNVSAAVPNFIPIVSGQPATLSYIENSEGNVDLSGTTFADGNGDVLTVALAITTGTFGATVADGSGVGGGVTVTRVNDTNVTLEGAAADINAYLAIASNITYIAPLNASGAGLATLTISATDGFDNLTPSPAISINVLPLSPVSVPTLDRWVQMLLIIMVVLVGAYHIPRYARRY